jgi:hypothetical protein
MMERLRVKTEKEKEEFYLALLKTPLADREETVVKWIQEANPDLDWNALPKDVTEALDALKEPSQ